MRQELGWRQGQLDKIIEIFNGRLLQGGLVFQQNFLVRSYELGPGFIISIEALTNLLQESALNHFKCTGLVPEGFGSTPEMSRKNLIWVVYKLEIVIDSYPSWNDVIQMDTWTCASGRNGMRRDWLARDYKTGKTLFRAVSVYVMMNKQTRKFSKYIEETREEFKGFFMDYCDPIIKDDGRKFRDLDIETADYVQTGIMPQWKDIDINEHVNHVKYTDWILESVPEQILETQRLSGIRLHFWKECGKKSVLQSLTAKSAQKIDEGIELEHTLRLERGSEILLKGRTTWMSKETNQ
ncbi:hypothetical protein UlMin_018081 [Ulmus minor]